MGFENKFQRWIEGVDSPETRCQSQSLCPFKNVDATPFCPRHGANKVVEARDKVQLRNFRLNQIWADDVHRFNISPYARQLLEEISLARLLIENLTNGCQDAYDLNVNSARIMSMLQGLKDLQLAYSKIEREAAKHLDREQVEALVADIVEIITKNVPDPEVRAKIDEEINASFERTVQKSADSGIEA